MQPKALNLLISLHSLAVSFSRNVAHLLSFAASEEVIMVMGAIFQPFEGRKRTYGDLEARYLCKCNAFHFSKSGPAQLPVFAELRLFPSPGEQLKNVDLGETTEFLDSVSKMDSSILLVISSMEEAVQRCMTFTGGSEAELLLKV